MKKFSTKEKAAFGLGAVGKDMVYALSSSYVMYYYQDILGLQATFVGMILMIARIFDAFNDPFMGILVAKTNTKYGKFRPWIISGSVLNAFVLYALFSAPSLSSSGLMIYFAIVYILWGVTYTMMDIPFWSMIPAVTEKPSDREQLSVIGRTCAGVGSALIQVGTVLCVSLLGGNSESTGFKWFSLIVAILFVVTESILFFTIKEKKSDKQMETTTVKEMFQALFHNDQAMVTVITIILINSALYITSNLILYFFKYDFGGEAWKTQYTLFTTVGGAGQILGMMLIYPLLRKKLSNETIFKTSLLMAITGYVCLLLSCFTNLSHVMPLLCAIGMLVFVANGMLSVLTTVFLSNSVDYGEIKTGRREESVIFSMQTFVVKAASGFAVFLSGIGLDLIGLNGNSADGIPVAQSASTITGLHLLMTILPCIGLVVAYILFKKKFILTDEKANEIAKTLSEKKI